MNVCSDDEDGVCREQIEFNDAKAHCKDTDDDSEEWDQKPVERLTTRVAHATHDTPTLRHDNTNIASR